MSQTQAAAAVDRLPWLADDPKPQHARPRAKRRTGAHDALVWAFAAALFAATCWMIAQRWNAQRSPEAAAERTDTPSAGPQPRIAEPKQPQVVFEPAPQVSPAPGREVSIARPHSAARSVEMGTRLTRELPSTAEIESVVAAQDAASEAVKIGNQAAEKTTTTPDSKPLTVWPATQSAGAKGRIVRVGAFGSRQQAKLGWRRMIRAYPAVAHLNATVVSDRNSRGRTFYRFQIGTTSQAHSEVLCQRMEKIRFSCAVVGLAWKPRGVER